MFRRGKRKSAESDNPMPELRRRAIHADPDAFGMERSDRFPNVFGFVMDTTYDNGVATLVVFADGTTSLYTSTGFGIVGGGGHPQVVRAGRALLRAADEHLAGFVPDASDEPPAEGMVTMRVLTYDGRLATTEVEETLGNGSGPFASIFHAAHAVIAELRQIDENRRQ